MQQMFDNLLYRTNNLRSRAESIQQFVVRFKRTNKDYLKIREVAEDHIKSVLAEEDKTKLLSIALNSVVEVLRQNPDMCANVVFNNDGNGNNNNGNGSNGYGNDSGDDIIGYGDPTTSPIAVYNGSMPPNANTDNNYNSTDEYQKGLLTLAKSVFNTFVNQITNQTLVTLETAEDIEE
jgi:hypothetical protein